MKKSIGTGLLVLGLFGCSTAQTGRVFLDSSTHEDSPPKWAKGTKNIWVEGDKIYFKTTQTIRGDERVNGCFDLGKLQSREDLISEIKNDMKVSIDNAQTSLSENSETVLGKVRSSEVSGSISGLRNSEQYFERYKIGETERIDCHLLSEISLADYNKVKNSVLNKLVAVDAKLKEAITQKQIDFFKHGPADADVRTPAAASSGSH